MKFYQKDFQQKAKILSENFNTKRPVNFVSMFKLFKSRFRTEYKVIIVVKETWSHSWARKRVSFNETSEFPFGGLKICVDFDLRDSKKMENINKLKK